MVRLGAKVRWNDVDRKRKVRIEKGKVTPDWVKREDRSGILVSWKLLEGGKPTQRAGKNAVLVCVVL